MKAIQVQKPGGPEVLTLVDLPVPKPRPNEAVVKLSAAGVNFIDIYFREGRYQAAFPFINGQEGAGVVSEVGGEVKSLKPGDRVAFTGRLGAYAEYLAVPEDRLVRVPEGMTDQQAAACMLQGMTVHYLVHDTFPLNKGDTALVHAAAGGVGLLLVQMAKQLGARVIGTVGSEFKAKLAREAGADEVILYAQQDFEAETKRITAGKRPRGYLVLFGGASGPVPPVDPLILSQKGSLFLTRPTLVNHIATREELEKRASDVMNMITAGKLKLRIEHTYALKDAAQAHRDLESRKTTGKLLLIP
jgi:NADPH2:quinone reductase